MSKSDIKGEMRLQPNINIKPIHSQHFRLPSPVAPSNPLSFFNGTRTSRRKWRKAIKCLPRDDLSIHTSAAISRRELIISLDVIGKYFFACLNAKWKHEVIGILSEQVKVYSSSRCIVEQKFYSLETPGNSSPTRSAYYLNMSLLFTLEIMSANVSRFLRRSFICTVNRCGTEHFVQ